MRLLITRPREDSEALSKRLREMGHTPVLHPFLDIIYDGPDRDQVKSLDFSKVQAVLITSANGIRALAKIDEQRNVRIIAVGDASARSARDLGYRDVASANGDVEALFKTVSESCSPDGGELVHIAGSHVAGDLQAMMVTAGFDFKRMVLYRSEKITSLSETIQEEIKNGQIDGVLFFSPRTAHSFVDLIKAAQLEKYIKSMVAYGLSAAVASKIEQFDFKAVKTASTPDQEALLSLLSATKDKAMTTNKKDDTSKSDPKVIDAKAEEVKVSAPDKKDGGDKAAPDAKKEEATKPDVKKVEPHVKPDAKDIKKAMAEDPKKPGADKPAGKDAKPDAKVDTKPGATAAKPAAPAKKKGSFKAKFYAASIIVLAAGGGAAYYLQDMWVPQVKAEIAKVLHIETPTAQDSRVDDVLARLEKLENRPAPTAATPVEMPSVDLQPLQDRLSALEEALAGLKTEVSSIEMASGSEDKLEEFKALAARLETMDTPAPAPVDLSGIEAQTQQLEESLAALTTRIGDVEMSKLAARSSADSAQALVAALSSLREVARTSSGFGVELATLEKIAGDDAALGESIAVLKESADSGVPSRAALAASFETTANNIVRATAIPEGAGWVEETVKNITSLVTIRRAPGHMDGEGALGAVARAEHNVAAGDLAAALSELETLDGKALEAAQGWIGNAKSRLATDQALSVMQSHVLSLIGSTGEQG